jgi:hypothetical protein
MHRDLTSNEAETLAFLLTPGFPGAEVLRAQAPTAYVVRKCNCGCATIDLGVDAAMPLATEAGEPVAVEAHGLPRSDGRPPPDLILFVRDGRLASLEIVSYSEDVFEVFPRTSEFLQPYAPPRET